MHTQYDYLTNTYSVDSKSLTQEIKSFIAGPHAVNERIMLLRAVLDTAVQRAPKGTQQVSEALTQLLNRERAALRARRGEPSVAAEPPQSADSRKERRRAPRETRREEQSDVVPKERIFPTAKGTVRPTRPATAEPPSRARKNKPAAPAPQPPPRAKPGSAYAAGLLLDDEPREEPVLDDEPRVDAAPDRTPEELAPPTADSEPTFSFPAGGHFPTVRERLLQATGRAEAARAQKDDDEPTVTETATLTSTMHTVKTATRKRIAKKKTVRKGRR
jgi:hypothetical protein